LNRVEDICGTLVKGLTLLCRCEASGCSLEQADAEMFLEL